MLAVLRDIAVEQGYAPADMKVKTEKIDLLAQKLRHDIAEYTRLCSNGEEPLTLANLAEGLKKELEQGLKELQQNE